MPAAPAPDAAWYVDMITRRRPNAANSGKSAYMIRVGPLFFTKKNETDHERDGRRAVRVGDDGGAGALVAVDLGDDEGHALGVAERRRVVDDDAALVEALGDGERVLLGEASARREDDNVEARRRRDAERIRRQRAPLLGLDGEEDGS